MASIRSPLRQYERHPPVDLLRFRKFIVEGRHVGWVRSSIAGRAATHSRVFHVDDRIVEMRDHLISVEARSQAMSEVLLRWRELGLVPGWRDELYPVNTRFGAAPLLLMERAAAPLFGVLCYGINVNGLTIRESGVSIWIGRRARAKQVDPGKLDVIVGGGQPHGLSLARNLVKECAEEAGIAEELAAKARPCGLVTLMIEAAEGLRVGLQFNFDLELPADFHPVNKDGEVAEFLHWPLEDVLTSLSEGDEFMFDVTLVMIDLLIRKGVIRPEDQGYFDLLAGLRRPIPFEAS